MTVFVDLLPALGFLMLNVFIPGPNVMNTIATAMGSGRRTGLSCAIACGCGLCVWAVVALLGAAAVFGTLPVAQIVMTTIGGLLLLYFALRYIKKSMQPVANFAAISNVSFRHAFIQAFLVMLSNPKVLTTWLAVISLFPIVVSDGLHIFGFTTLASLGSFCGHAFVATLFSTGPASRLYMRLYRPINAAVGIGFCLYGLKLLSNLVG